MQRSPNGKGHSHIAIGLLFVFALALLVLVSKGGIFYEPSNTKEIESLVIAAPVAIASADKATPRTTDDTASTLSSPPSGEAVEQQASTGAPVAAVVDQPPATEVLSPPPSPSAAPPSSSSSLPPADLNIAVMTLLTTSPKEFFKHIKDLAIDSALVLHRSILRVLPSDVRVVHDVRPCGTEAFSPAAAAPTDGIRHENVTIHRFSIAVPPGKAAKFPGKDVITVDLRFVALVTPEVSPTHSRAMNLIGFELWPSHSIIAPSEIRNEQIRSETFSDGSIGYSEFAKLNAFVTDYFDKILVIDTDIMFFKMFTELIFIDQAFAWTQGGWAGEYINSGFVVVNPKSPYARKHLENMVELIREGDFRPGSGWRGKGIGWTYGGRTLQGVLPHYFLIESKTHDPDPHYELNGCHYNLLDTERCNTTTIADMTDHHYTGACGKPWWCYNRDESICAAVTDRWLVLYREILQSENALVQQMLGDKASDALVLNRLNTFTNSPWVPNGGECPLKGDFFSVGGAEIKEKWGKPAPKAKAQ